MVDAGTEGLLAAAAAGQAWVPAGLEHLQAPVEPMTTADRSVSTPALGVPIQIMARGFPTALKRACHVHIAQPTINTALWLMCSALHPVLPHPGTRAVTQKHLDKDRGQHPHWSTTACYVGALDRVLVIPVPPSAAPLTSHQWPSATHVQPPLRLGGSQPQSWT